jgi:hypothetical protein
LIFEYRKESPHVIKQRILGLALSLALLGTAAFSLTASAAGDNVVVTGTTQPVISISIDASNISLGTNLQFNGEGQNVYYSCPGATFSGGLGSAFLGPYNPGVAVTVVSSNNYDVTRSALFTSSSVANTRLFVAPVADCGDLTNGTSISTTNASFTGYLSNQPATLGSTTNQVFGVDVLAGDPAGSIGASIVYTAQFHV